MKNIKELTEPAVWLFIAASVMMASWHIGLGEYRHPGPGFFPFWSALLLGVLSLSMAGKIYLQKDAVASGEKADLWKGLNRGKNTIVIAALFVYCLILPKLGYLLSTMALMMALFYAGKMRLWALIALAMLAVLLSYLIFYFGLKTPLPRGIWGF